MTTSKDGVGDTDVIVTCFNESRYILTALRSILDQTAAGRIRQVIVVDDGSTDGSIEIVEELARSEPKIRLLHGEGGGVASARNLALGKVDASYVAILDGDDIWLPEKLERQLPILDRDPRVGLVYSDILEFSDAAPERQRRVYARSLTPDQTNVLADYYLHDAPIIPSTMVMRKSTIDEIGPFDVDLKVGEDTDYCLRAAERTRFCHIPEPLIRKRQHASSLSSQQDRLWPNHVLISDRFADRNPELKKLTRPRLSRRAAKVGWGMVQVGDRKRAAVYLMRSLRYRPWNVRAYAYLGLAMLPHSIALQLHGFVGSRRRWQRKDPAS